ncbi:MAG: YafY family transcriptional regulator [Treponema sp.]|jgi:predicted DNA-binding transcriptional regulator YafY|nr:YafY family transcriptional regulator [Treponema sp.]
MKTDRLLAITFYLLNHEKTSASVLARRFGVSVRTIQRDIESLCFAGIPVAAEYGAEGGYEILDTFHLEKQAVNQTDYQYIATALQALVSASGDSNAACVLEKVQAASEVYAVTNRNKSAADGHVPGTEVQLDLSVALENPGISGTISVIRDAVRKGMQLEFLYTNSTDETKLHTVDPVFAVFKWYAWYLIAWYEQKQAYCMFKLVRMRNIHISSTPVTKKHDAEKVRRELDDRQDTRRYITIKLRADKSIKMKCLEYMRGTVTEEFPDGSFILTARFPEEEYYWYSILLGFGTKVRVLEPPELIERIQNDCAAIAALYKNSAG